MLAGLIAAGTLGSPADRLVEHALSHGGPATAPPSGEVGAVASVTLDAIPAIGAAWRALLPGVQLSMTGVFCHGSPKVDVDQPAGPTKRCELADLLVVTDEVNATGAVIDRRAALIQAKLVKSGTVTPDPVQHHLLTTWSSFRFSSAAYDPRSRDFTAGGPGLSDDGGRYGAIDFGPATRTWEQTPPASPSPPGPALGTFIADMLLGAAGAGREATSGGGDDWSFTVDELLRVTASLSFAFTPSLGPGRAPRGIVAYAIDPPPPVDVPGPRPERELGISAIVVQAYRRR